MTKAGATLGTCAPPPHERSPKKPTGYPPFRGSDFGSQSNDKCHANNNDINTRLDIRRITPGYYNNEGNPRSNLENRTIQISRGRVSFKDQRWEFKFKKIK